MARGVVDEQHALQPVYPNPARTTATITFTLPRASEVVVTIHDIPGRQARVLTKGHGATGIHHVTFDARSVASVYFVQLRVGALEATESVVVVK